jgi:Fe-S oxidoreductase
MLHCTDPEKSARLRKTRVAQFPKDRIVASSCEGCLSAFRIENRETAHLLELLFGKSKSRGWGNRIKNTWK